MNWIKRLVEKIVKWDDGKCYKCPYLYKDCYGNMCQASGWCVRDEKRGDIEL